MRTICRNCKYWQATDKNVDLGYCHRYAPRPVAVSPLAETSNMDAVWPRTGADEWCGEGDPKVEAA